MKNLLKISSNERIDIGDFNHVAVNSASDQVNELIHNFLCNPDGDDRFILSGFDMSNPSGNQVRVENGKAIIHQRLDGQIVESVLSTSGDDYKIVDMATYPNNTYYIYISFEHTPGDSQGRIFWNPSGTGSEYTQTVTTRYLANWSVRIETSSPGQEWFRIGTVVMPSMSITDNRDLYFEGKVEDSYASGWSSDGGGSANDRDDDRKTYGIVDLHTFVAATRQCLEDIKGRGIRHWYSKNIGGMNIGFDDDPVANALYINNTGFGLTSSTTGVYRTMKFTDTTYLRYSTSASNLVFRYASDDLLTMDSSGSTFSKAVNIEADSGYIALEVQGKGNTPAIDATAETGTNGHGVRGTAKGEGYGIHGLSSSDAGDSYGVVGIGYQNTGVFAQSSGLYPAIDATATGNIHAISGRGGSGGNDSHGVKGEGGSAGGAGIYGKAGSGSGIGVKCDPGDDGVALNIVASADTPVGFSDGDIYRIGTSLYIVLGSTLYTFDLSAV